MARKSQLAGPAVNGRKRLKGKEYDHELRKLQPELVETQEWVKATGARIVVVFEGRDAAGKGGVIQRIMERVSPRVFRHVTLPAPAEREKTLIHAQRYVQYLPAAGEVMLFDHSWYNRALVEHVMGFCKTFEYEEFLRLCPSFEMLLQNNGIILVKYWFEVSEQEQHRRFLKRIKDPMRRWEQAPWTWNRTDAGMTTRGPGTRCSQLRTRPSPPGMSCKPTISSGRGSIALPTY